MGMDQDDYVLAPYTSVMKRILAQDYLSQIIASAVTEGVTEQATSEMTSILRRTHKLKEATDIHNVHNTNTTYNEGNTCHAA